MKLTTYLLSSVLLTSVAADSLRGDGGSSTRLLKRCTDPRCTNDCASKMVEAIAVCKTLGQDAKEGCRDAFKAGFKECCNTCESSGGGGGGGSDDCFRKLGGGGGGSDDCFRKLLLLI